LSYGPTKEELLRQFLAYFEKFDRKVERVIPKSPNLDTKRAKSRITGSLAIENT
jgi:hypothetical protein